MPSAPQHWRLRQNCSPLHSSGGFVKASLRSTTLEASSKLASAPQQCRLCQNCPTLHNVSGLVNSCALHSELLLVSSKLLALHNPSGLVKAALHSAKLPASSKLPSASKAKHSLWRRRLLQCEEHTRSAIKARGLSAASAAKTVIP